MTSSEIFIKSCQEKNVDQYIVGQFSKDPQGLWDSMEDPYYMLHLLSKFSGEVDSTSRKATTKCLIEIVKPCMVNIPEKEKRPWILMEVLERYCEGTVTLEEVKKKARDTLSDVLDYASLAVWYCANFALVNDYYASNAADDAASSEGDNEKQYNKNSCETIRKHFPSIPGMESVKAEENKNGFSIKNETTVTVSFGNQNFVLNAEELKKLKDFVKDLN